MPQYEWSPESRGFFRRADAQAVGDRIEQLEQELGGTVTRHSVVRDAELPASPLHQCFEWDDAKEAHQWRLHTANGLLHALVIKIPRDGALPLTTRAFVCLRGEEPTEGAAHPYMSVRLAMELDGTRRAVLAQAKRELESWRRRYAELEELVALFELIDATVAA